MADEALEDALYDSQALREFAGIELNVDPASDATTLLKLRYWLECHDFTQALFEEVALMKEHGLLMRRETIMDATIIAAPSATKNRSGLRIRRCTRRREATGGTSG